jgi:glutamine amidotransferase
MIAIVDYQMGNLRSVQKGFGRVGHQATITDDPTDLRRADKIVLPGVGAFGDAMDELRRRRLVDPICEAIAAGKPFLGICLGLQLLFDVSYEGGRHEGLGVLRGEVVRFDLPSGYKVPHMGWNQARFLRPVPILQSIPDGAHFYFVHSYFVIPADQAIAAVETEYHKPFCAMICRGKLFGTQFHPEKSQRHGLAILKNFAELS